VPDPQVLAAYGLFFAFGWLLWHERDRLDTFRRDAWIQVGIATALAPINLIMTLRAGESPGARVLASLTGALMVWLFVFGLTGLFLRHLNRPSARVRYIVDSSYWLYLIHLPFTIWVPGLLSHLSWPAFFKVVALLAISTPFWVLSYDLLVRPTFIGKVLNGRRYPRGLPHPDTLSADASPAVGRAPLPNTTATPQS
jgi:peptidoglycan/LPS O-acetylase OafA/YrhL